MSANILTSKYMTAKQAMIDGYRGMHKAPLFTTWNEVQELNEQMQSAAVELAEYMASIKDGSWRESVNKSDVTPEDGHTADMIDVMRQALLEKTHQWVHVVEVTKDQFYSKTSRSYRAMWRLLTTDGRSVNVFDHADPLRDQKSLLQGAGYLDTFESMDIAQVDRWDTFPIQVELVADGAFWKVVCINTRDEDAMPEAPFSPADLIDDDDVDESVAHVRANLFDDDDNLIADEPDTDLARLTKVIKSGDFVILDTETTGLYDDAEICQIAIISSSGKTLLNTLVKTKYPIPEQATRIHGITNEAVSNAPRWLDIRNDVWECLFGKTVITYNAVYDFKLLMQTEKATDAASQWDWTMLGNECAMLAYGEHRGVWNEYHDGWKWHKLTDAASRIGYTLPDGMSPHSALSDCLMTYAVCQHLAGQE